MKSSLRESSPKQRSLTLDFDGGVKLYRNVELGMDIPMCIAPSGISAQRRAALMRRLNREFSAAGVRFAPGKHGLRGGFTLASCCSATI